MIYPHKKIINNQEGAAMIEFAIILPLLLLLIFGTIEFSLFLYNKQVITNAAREGARRGVIMRKPIRDVVTEDAEIIARVNEFAKSYLITFGDDTFDTETDPDDVIIGCSFDDPDNPGVKIILDERKDDPTNSEILKFGTDLIVEVNYEYQFLFLSIDFLFFSGIGPINITSVATMRME